MLPATHARARREKPSLVAGLYVDRDLISLARYKIGMHGPPTIGAFIPERHVDYFTHYLTPLMARVMQLL
jgi:hypothetical protein